MRAGWEYKKLGDFISPAIVLKNRNGNDLPILSITMHDGIVSQKERFKKKIASVDTTDYKIVKNGQLVIAFPIDEGLLYTQDVVEEGIMSPAYNIWDVNYNLVTRKFLVLYLHSNYAFAYYRSKLRGTTMRRRSIPREDLLSMPFPLPSIPQQRLIVSELDEINSLIALKREQLKKYDELAQSLFYEMFGDPVENEKGWEVKKLGELCVLKSGDSKANSAPEGKLPYVKVGDLNLPLNAEYIVYSSRFVDRDFVGKNIFPVGSIIFPKRGESIRTNKKRITKVEICCDLNLMGVYSKDPSLLPLYLFYYFKTINFCSIVKESSTIPQINNGEIAPLPLPLPPLSLQRLFAHRIEQIEEQKKQVTAAIAKLETLLASRMQYWFE